MYIRSYYFSKILRNEKGKAQRWSVNIISDDWCLIPLPKSSKNCLSAKFFSTSFSIFFFFQFDFHFFFSRWHEWGGRLFSGCSFPFFWRIIDKKKSCYVFLRSRFSCILFRSDLKLKGIKILTPSVSSPFFLTFYKAWVSAPRSSFRTALHFNCFNSGNPVFYTEKKKLFSLWNGYPLDCHWFIYIPRS